MAVERGYLTRVYGPGQIGQAGSRRQSNRRVIWRYSRSPLATLPRSWLGSSWLVAAVLHILVGAIYYWLATRGTLTFGTDEHYYGLLAEAFLAGQLHLKVEPHPGLLTLPKPYELYAYATFGAPHDVALYEGKFYLYWGPMPGVVHAVWRGATGLPASTMALQVMLGVGTCLWFWLLARELRDRVYPCISDGMVFLAWLCFALGGASPFMQTRPWIYHESILWASFFTLGSFYFLLRGLGRERGAPRFLIVAGLLLGCAVGSRATHVAYAGAAGLALFWPWLRAPKDPVLAWRLVLYCLPLGTILAALLAYNFARFGSPLEFGSNYPLPGAWAPPQYDLHFVPHSLALYLFHVPRWLPFFPFLYSPLDSGWDDTVLYEGDWVLEFPFAAIPLMAPLVLLAFVPPWRGDKPGGRQEAATAFVFAASLGVVVCFGFLQLFGWTTTRYLHDILPLGCVLGSLGLWRLSALSASAWGGRVYGTLCGLIAGTSVVMGMMLGFAGVSMAPAGAATVYAADRVMVRTLDLFGGAAWRPVYLNDVLENRRWGVFSPRDGEVVLPAPPGATVVGLALESVWPTPLPLAIEIDGQDVGRLTVPPGREGFRLERGAVVGPSGRVAVRLRVADGSPPDVDHLWPVRVFDLHTLDRPGGTRPFRSDK